MTPGQRIQVEWHRQKIEMWADDLHSLIEEIEAEHKRMEDDPTDFTLGLMAMMESESYFREYLREISNGSPDTT